MRKKINILCMCYKIGKFRQNASRFLVLDGMDPMKLFRARKDSPVCVACKILDLVSVMSTVPWQCKCRWRSRTAFVPTGTQIMRRTGTRWRGRGEDGKKVENWRGRMGTSWRGRREDGNKV